MIAVIIVAYMIGSIPFALMLARGRSVSDLRQIGSGNIGATNVVRASGMTAGVAVALLDMAKGAAGVLLAERLDGSLPPRPRQASRPSSVTCFPCGCSFAAARAWRLPAASSCCSRRSRRRPHWRYLR